MCILSSICWLTRYLAEALKKRPDLKVIVTSSTLDAEKFSKYFYSCPIFTIPGRMYPVETLYAKEPETDYMDTALITVMQIHLSEPPGDILLFLTGQEEVDAACEILFELMKALGPKYQISLSSPSTPPSYSNLHPLAHAKPSLQPTSRRLV